ncbi:hypothetical protein ACAX46_004236 [Providencia rettgeri]
MKQRKRLTNVEWLIERFKLIRKFKDHTPRQQVIIQLLDKTELSPLEFKQLHYLATEEKVELQKQEAQLRVDRLEQQAKRLERRAKMRTKRVSK